MTVADDNGEVRFRATNIDGYNSNGTGGFLFLNMTTNLPCRMHALGIGANAGTYKLNVAGGNVLFGSNFQVNGSSTLNGDILINSSGRIFQRADVNNSLNVISTEEINFSLQTDRTTDPTTSTIALQLNDTNGITINRPVVNNQSFYSIGNIRTEGDLTCDQDFSLKGQLLFQHSSAIHEALNGTDYDLLIWNGDTDRSLIFRVGAIGTTPELQIDGKINLLGNLEITHSDVAGSQRVLIDNPDNDGFIRLSNNNLSRLDATNTGVDVYGFFTTTNNADINGTLTCTALIETSDSKLKENIKEVNNKDCFKVVKYIQPKTYNFIKDEEKKSNLGFIADDVKDAKIPKEWDNIIFHNDDGMKLLA